MNLEDSVRSLVAQVLDEMGKTGSIAPSSGGSSTPPSPQATAAAVVDNGEALPDLSQIDLQRTLLVKNPVNQKLYEEMMLSTPARIGVGRCGSRPLTQTLLRFRADHAVAQDAVLGEVSEDLIAKYNLVSLKSACHDKDEFLTRPDLGRKLDDESIEKLRKECQAGAQVQIIIADGLSSTAIEANLADLYPALSQGLSTMGIKLGTPIFVKYGRVAIMDVIGELLKPEVAVILIGERPGLGTAESMSAYMAYNPRAGMVESERSVISNIHKGGTPAVEAGAHLASFVKRIVDAKMSGVNLK